jgi:hypothetical protein
VSLSKIDVELKLDAKIISNGRTVELALKAYTPGVKVPPRIIISESFKIGGKPYRFQLPYDPTAIESKYDYGVTAYIEVSGEIYEGSASIKPTDNQKTAVIHVTAIDPLVQRPVFP